MCRVPVFAEILYRHNKRYGQGGAKMGRYMLSPSLMAGNLLNIAEDVRLLDAANVEMLHLDMMDPTFLNSTAIPPAILPQLLTITQTPLDIHLMSRVPEKYFPLLLPYCKGSFLVLHIEATCEFNWLASEIRASGAKPGVCLNSSTNVLTIKETLPSVDMVQIMLADAGRPMNIAHLWRDLCKKVAAVTEMCHDIDRGDMVIQCDMGIAFNMAKELIGHGANSLVLGRDSVFFQKEPLDERIKMLRDFLDT